jgi:hypothetical protein
MKLVRNTGNDRFADLIHPAVVDGRQLDAVTPGFSIFAWAQLLRGLRRAGRPVSVFDLRR